MVLIYCGRRVKVKGRPEVWVVIRKHAGGLIELEREHNPLRRMAVPRDALRPVRSW